MTLPVLILLLYVVSLLGIFLFGLGQVHLSWVVLKKKRLGKKKGAVGAPRVPKALGAPPPRVTIQLPLYNERYVVLRLLEAVLCIDYPKDRLEIQVIDDSTDDTTARIRSYLARLPKETRSVVHHLRRGSREGYKAGALRSALSSAKGEFLALFDADFVPPKDFLRRMLPYFDSPDVGFVQARWGHLNAAKNWLTRLQAFGLDAHFVIEQEGRHQKGYFTNFNGTAGLWRKSCVEDAGGWHADTLTEDLDLSYRAQLKGWRSRYVEEVVCPAELPLLMPSVKMQQLRWNKGAAQNFRKHIFSVLRSKRSMAAKCQAFLHLGNSSVFPLILLNTLSSVPLLWVRQLPTFRLWFDLSTVFLLGYLGIWFFYGVATYLTQQKHKRWSYFLGRFPLFLSFSMALSWHNTWAVLSAWRTGRRGGGTFVRTPKLGEARLGTQTKYLRDRGGGCWVEGLLLLYFLSALGWAIYWLDFALVPYHALLVLGYGGVVYHSLKAYFLLRS